MAVTDVRSFHRVTEHAPGDPARGGPFDPSIEPAKVKRYRDLDVEPLPDRWDEPATQAAALLSSVEQPARRAAEMDLASVARLVFLSNGVTRTMARGGRRRRFRAAPSAGALYPIELYAVCGDLPGLPAGVYHHAPHEHGLHRLRDGDHRPALAAAADDEALAAAPVTLVCTGILWRTSWKYGPRGYRHLYWDAGVVVANMLAAARAAGRSARALAGFVDDEVSELLGLGGAQPFPEWPLVVVPVGGDRSRPSPPAGSASVRPLELEVAPLGPRRVDEPEVERVHAETTLDERSAVAAWREALRDAELPRAASAIDPPDDAERVGVEEIILRRGSTRAFAAASIPVEHMRWCLDVGMRPVPGDLADDGRTALGLRVAAHAVEGLRPGGYRWSPAGLERDLDDQPREATAHLCLDQELGGLAAITAFLLADLDRLLDRAGPRAYRVAQLAAGIAAGRMQLAAFTVGVGGTGLTFYDDEIRRHFGTSEDPMLVTAIGHPAYRPSRGHRPSG